MGYLWTFDSETGNYYYDNAMQDALHMLEFEYSIRKRYNKHDPELGIISSIISQFYDSTPEEYSYAMEHMYDDYYPDY